MRAHVHIHDIQTCIRSKMMVPSSHKDVSVEHFGTSSHKDVSVEHFGTRNVIDIA